MVDGKKVLVSLVLSTHSLIDASRYTKLPSELLFLKQTFLKNGYSKHLMNKIF